MCQDKRLLALIGFFVLSFCAISAKFAPGRLRCDIARKCSDEAQFVWATDGNHCAVFQNNCQFQNHNCQRLDNKQRVLKPVEQEDCVKHCPDACTEEFNPFCTTHNGALETVSNPCVWTQKICQSGEAFVFQFKGACEA